MEIRKKFSIRKHDRGHYEFEQEHKLADLIVDGWNIVYQSETPTEKITIIESPAINNHNETETAK